MVVPFLRHLHRMQITTYLYWHLELEIMRMIAIGRDLFKNLKKAYIDRKWLYFVFNRHNSIKNAIEIVHPERIHGISLYHLLKNLKTNFNRSGHNISQSFNSTICAYSLLEFEYHMQQFDTINEETSEYLVSYYILYPGKMRRIYL